MCKRRIPPGVVWALPVLWMALIFGVSSRSTLPSLPSFGADALLKKSAHAIEYAILLALWWVPFSRLWRWDVALAAAWTCAVLYAISDEVHQTFVPGRTGRVLDVAVDAFGATLAALAIRWKRRTP